MDEAKAKEILGEAIRHDGSLGDVGEGYVAWDKRKDKTSPADSIFNVGGGIHARLDGDFTADELEAIAWWMRKNA